MGYSQLGNIMEDLVQRLIATALTACATAGALALTAAPVAAAPFADGLPQGDRVAIAKCSSGDGEIKEAEEVAVCINGNYDPEQAQQVLGSLGSLFGGF
ncbi:hypothetical protein [Nocardiopsis ansamitocini]|uniref:Secreted protein n=1 Tax=Nocardiopsis ansamitocini TaxID=1670832 RepID=A0A9W6P9R5_9ACTN|nr:hypothetical protein [Nocardiopsis ansamitocini]GLU50219.1 hypothetical protein Nans01_45700 [Nocardiopsis ansamitocini]